MAQQRLHEWTHPRYCEFVGGPEHHHAFDSNTSTSTHKCSDSPGEIISKGTESSSSRRSACSIPNLISIVAQTKGRARAVSVREPRSYPVASSRRQFAGARTVSGADAEGLIGTFVQRPADSRPARPSKPALLVRLLDAGAHPSRSKSAAVRVIVSPPAAHGFAACPSKVAAS